MVVIEDSIREGVYENRSEAHYEDVKEKIYSLFKVMNGSIE